MSLLSEWKCLLRQYVNNNAASCTKRRSVTRATHTYLAGDIQDTAAPLPLKQQAILAPLPLKHIHAMITQYIGLLKRSWQDENQNKEDNNDDKQSEAMVEAVQQSLQQTMVETTHTVSGNQQLFAQSSKMDTLHDF